MTSIDISSLLLSVTDCYNMASSPDAGGQAIFVGTVRNQTQNKKVLKLVFEAYTPMAIKEMQKNWSNAGGKMGCLEGGYPSSGRGINSWRYCCDYRRFNPSQSSCL